MLQVASFMTLWSKMQPDYAANMWNEALNKRLGTQVNNFFAIVLIRCLWFLLFVSSEYN